MIRPSDKILAEGLAKRGLLNQKEIDRCLEAIKSSDETLKSYQDLATELEILSAPVYYLAGNHDNPIMLEQGFLGENIKQDKQIICGNWQIILLNSRVAEKTEGYLDAQELQFLQDCLSTYPKHFALVAVHHHAVPVHGSMDEIMLQNASEFLALLEKHESVKVVLQGHVHQELAVVRQGIHFFTTPSTCYQIKPGCPSLVVDDQPAACRWLSIYPEGDFTSLVMRV